MSSSSSALLNVDQLAEYLAVSPGYVRRLVREGRIPFVKIGKFVRFQAEDVALFVESGRVDVRPG